VPTLGPVSKQDQNKCNRYILHDVTVSVNGTKQIQKAANFFPKPIAEFIQ